MTLTPNDVQKPYNYEPWPKWLTGPEGQRQIFNSEEEVPEGWMAREWFKENFEPSPDEEETGEAEQGEDKDQEEGETEEKSASKIDPLKLASDHSQKQLVEMLKAMQRVDEDIEFLPSWPKPRLVKTILDNGGPLED